MEARRTGEVLFYQSREMKGEEGGRNGEKNLVKLHFNHIYCVHAAKVNAPPSNSLHLSGRDSKMKIHVK